MLYPPDGVIEGVRLYHGKDCQSLLELPYIYDGCRFDVDAGFIETSGSSKLNSWSDEFGSTFQLVRLRSFRDFSSSFMKSMNRRRVNALLSEQIALQKTRTMMPTSLIKGGSQVHHLHC
jgi:hypothetical protein